jgi:UDP-N-acetylglucosamine acyltransferase
VPTVHPTAIIHPDARLAQDVEVGPFCTIEQDVEIGAGSRLDPYAQVLRYTRVGQNCRIHSQAVIGGEPQDMKFRGEPSTLEIGDNTVIREFVTIHRGTEGGGGVTRVGNSCLLMAYVHVAHDCILGDHVILSNAAMLAGHVVIGSHAVVGGMTGVHQFVHIGEHAFVGAMSGLPQDVPPYLLASGSRARLHGPNIIGLRRHGFSQEFLNALRSCYRRIFRSETPRRQALEESFKEFGHLTELGVFFDFIRNSERGLLSANVKNGEPGSDSSPERD